ncbi:hypothetical protein EHO59_12865 [Leptospira semungkisensis]|uniref:Uncharacterized protein n=1 Tax=Leptospira semungkisensis TaxID=2484985 RepID=A0A4R9FQ67_9LEPT|nr:hypothetical protein [Leptospira semungkisensis]TGK00818.1 hypothetical protein EHO59_12865 [Leptospira semungkisensis]
MIKLHWVIANQAVFGLGLFVYSIIPLLAENQKTGLIDSYVSSDSCGIYAERKLIQEPLKVVNFGEKVFVDSEDKGLIDAPWKHKSKWFDGKPWVQLKDPNLPSGWMLWSCLSFGEDGKSRIKKSLEDSKLDPCLNNLKLRGIWKSNSGYAMSICINSNGLMYFGEEVGYSFNRISGKNPIRVNATDLEMRSITADFIFRFLSDRKLVLTCTSSVGNCGIISPFKKEKEVEFEKVNEETVAPDGLRGRWTRSKAISSETAGSVFSLDLCKMPIELKEIVSYNLEQSKSFSNFNLETSGKSKLSLYFFDDKSTRRLKIYEFRFRSDTKIMREGNRGDDFTFQKCD